MTEVPPELKKPIESVGFAFLGRTSLSVDWTIKGYVNFYFEFWLEEPGRSILKKRKIYQNNSCFKDNPQELFYRQKSNFDQLKEFKHIRLYEFSQDFNSVVITRNAGWDKYKVSVNNQEFICFGMGRE